MKLYYDLHIHSALSPCADLDMTPNNIVNMALLKELDVIAVTDHNSCGNAASVLEAAKDTPLTVIPGMEVETSEEVHVLCYFPDLNSAMDMSAEIQDRLPGIQNAPEIFGEQYYFDAEDRIVAKEDKLLIVAAKITLEELLSAVRARGGICVPAHIDRSSNSILSNLGFISPNLGIKTVEIRYCAPKKYFEDYRDYKIISGSDAHTLGDISEPQCFFTYDKCSKNIPEFLKILCENT